MSSSSSRAPTQVREATTRQSPSSDRPRACRAEFDGAGLCRRGSTCAYAHSTEELAAPTREALFALRASQSPHATSRNGGRENHNKGAAAGGGGGGRRRRPGGGGGAARAEAEAEKEEAEAEEAKEEEMESFSEDSQKKKQKKKQKQKQPHLDTKEKKQTKSGFVFLCDAKTQDEVLTKRLFGLPAPALASMTKRIDDATLLFLWNFKDRVLHGPFARDGPCDMNLDKHAFRGKFPAQLRFAFLPPGERGDDDDDATTPRAVRLETGVRVEWGYRADASPLSRQLETGDDVAFPRYYDVAVAAGDDVRGGDGADAAAASRKHAQEDNADGVAATSRQEEDDRLEGRAARDRAEPGIKKNQKKKKQKQRNLRREEEPETTTTTAAPSSQDEDTKAPRRRATTGFVFRCNDVTEPLILRDRVFRVRAPLLRTTLGGIADDTLLFLNNHTASEVVGPFERKAEPGLDLVPASWSRAFRAHLPFRLKSGWDAARRCAAPRYFEIGAIGEEETSHLVEALLSGSRVSRRRAPDDDRDKADDDHDDHGDDEPPAVGSLTSPPSDGNDEKQEENSDSDSDSEGSLLLEEDVDLDNDDLEDDDDFKEEEEGEDDSDHEPSVSNGHGRSGDNTTTTTNQRRRQRRRVAVA